MYVIIITEKEITMTKVATIAKKIKTAYFYSYFGFYFIVKSPFSRGLIT